MKKLITAILLSQSIAFSEDLTRVKACHDKLIDEIFLFGAFQKDLFFIPSPKDKQEFLISNGQLHYLCSSSAPIADIKAIKFDPVIDGLSDKYLAVKKTNSKSWLLNPARENTQIDMTAKCQVAAPNDQRAAEIYTESTRLLIQEMRTKHIEDKNSIQNSYGYGIDKKKDNFALATKYHDALNFCLDVSALQQTANENKKYFPKPTPLVKTNQPKGQDKTPATLPPNYRR